jgi:hypothetical protein
MRNKNRLKLLAFIASWVFSFTIFTSCNEEFSPYGTPRDEFVLNCILANDKSSQNVYLTKSYFVESEKLNSLTNDPAINGADIRISYLDSVKILKADLTTRIDTSRFGSKTVYYLAENFSARPGITYRIDVLLPNNKRLSATTKTPADNLLYYNKGDQLVPPAGRDYVICKWDNNPDYYIAPNYTFYYFIHKDGETTVHKKNVPLSYVEKNGKYVPIFPEPSHNTAATIEMSTFNRAMQEISEGDPDKSRYEILGFILEFRIFDKNLTNYYASVNEVTENFAVNLDEGDFTNINGGRGIFGSYITKYFVMLFSHNYIRSFGYTPGLAE